MEEENIEERLRRDALVRISNDIHPEIELKHEPINGKECDELRQELRDLVKGRMASVRREYETLRREDYDQVYGEFVRMTLTNEAQHR